MDDFKPNGYYESLIHNRQALKDLDLDLLLKRFKNSDDRLLALRSIDAESYPDNLTSSFIINFKEAITCRDDEQMYLSLYDAQIPFSFYSVNSNNNILEVIEPTKTISITISEGNYNVYDLAKTVVNLLNSQSSQGYSIIYNKQKNKYIFGLTNGNATFKFSNTKSPGLLFGFSTIDINITASNPMSSINVAQMLPYNALYIRTNITFSNVMSSRLKTYTDILAKVNINSPPNGIITYQAMGNDHMSSIPTRNITSIGVKLTDSDNNLINLNGLNWDLSLRITIKKIS